MNKKHEDILRKFKNAYKGCLAPKTLSVYVNILRYIMENRININSKSRWLQVRSVLSKCEDIGIKVDYKLIKWTRRGDNIKRNLIDKYITHEQFKKILEAIPNTPKGKELRFAVSISYYTGLRCNEVLSITGKDVKVVDDYITITVSAKGLKTHKVIVDRKFEDKWDLIDFPGLTITDDYVRKTLLRISKKIGIPCNMHNFRHVFASNLLQRTNDLLLVQKALNHSQLQTSSIYLHCINADEKYKKAMGY